MMLHLHPELVRIELIPNEPNAEFPPYDMFPTRTEWVPASGVLSSARGATAEKGARICAEVIERMAAAVRAEFGP
jgi:creatinine amidohydrolase